MLKGSEKCVVRAILLSFPLSPFLFGVGRPDWSFDVNGHQHLHRLPKTILCTAHWTLNNVQHRRNYNTIQVIFIVLLPLFCLQQHIKFDLLIPPEGGKFFDVATGLLHVSRFILPHYFHISQSRIVARYGLSLLLLLLINFQCDLSSLYI